MTKYSSDPTDLEDISGVNEKDGLVSVTTTQKFGTKGAPSLDKALGKEVSLKHVFLFTNISINCIIPTNVLSC